MDSDVIEKISVGLISLVTGLSILIGILEENIFPGTESLFLMTGILLISLGIIVILYGLRVQDYRNKIYCTFKTPP